MTSRQPLVTVILPVRDGERFLGAAIDSLLAQTCPDFSLIVVDDGSRDRTAEILAGCTDSRVRVVHNAAPAGPAGARNLAIEHVTTEYIAFFDADDLAEPHRLETQLAWLRARPGVGVVAARAAVIDEHDRLTGAVYGYAGAAEALGASMLFRNQLATSTVIVRRSVLGRERFDATLPVASDYDMWLRLADRTAIACLPDVLVRYRMHAANLTHTGQGDAEACVRRITERQLARVGIAVSADELDLHRRLGAHRPEGSRVFVRAAGEWLDRLEDANVRSGHYAEDAFRDVIAAEWLAVCDAAAKAGCWSAWPSIVQGRWTARLATAASGRHQLAPLPWRTMRGYVRRRWPAIGLRARTLLARQPRVH